MEQNDPIIVQQDFEVPKNTVWNAITNVSEMRHWFFDNIPDFEAVEGFYTEFNVSSGQRNFLHQWKIIEVIPLKKIVYDWSYHEYAGRGIVTFELNDTNQQTRITVTSVGMDSFDADIPEFKRESCIAGWNYFIKQNLLAYLQGD